MTTEVSDFENQVIARSFERPVLVDFWAEWCGPCRMLGPVLEKLAAEEDERWELAKLNTDENQEIAQRFGIMSIPAVKLFANGEVVDEFVGALPEASVRSWLDKALPSKHQATLELAQRAMAQDPEMAGHFLDNVLANDPQNVDATVLKAQLQVFDDPQGAAQRIQGLDIKDAGIFQRAEAIRTLAHLTQLEELAEAGPGTEEYLEAARLIAARELEPGLGKLLEAVRLNRQLDGDGPRLACLALFTLLGDSDPLTRQYRRALERALF